MMGWMFRCLVTCWMWCSLLSMLNAEEEPELGGPAECNNAHFIPGYNLGGEGFDVVKMERKGSFVIDMEKWDIGNGSCRMYPNAYLKNVKQKIPAAVTYWRSLSKCAKKVGSMIYDSSEALVKGSTSSISNNWKIGLDVPLKASVSLGGTHSREATYAMDKSKEDKYSFTKHVVKCSLYSYKIASSPPLHQEFLQAVRSLPPEYNKESYQGIIDMFGTHYTTGVELGGRMQAVTAIRTCQASMSGLTETAVKDCLDVEASGTYKGVTLKVEDHHCQELKKRLNTNDKFSSMFNERQTDIIGGNINGEDILFSSTSHPNALNAWLESLKTIPDVVMYSLQPLHSVLDNKHPAKKGLKKAIETYILENGLKNVCSESCKIGHRTNPRDRCACDCETSQVITANCCPAEKNLATLKVFRLRANKLYGDKWTETDGSVEVTFGKTVRRTEVITDDNNPRWRETFEYGPVKLSISQQLTFKVYDADSYWNSDLLGECSFDLRSGDVTETCYFEYGTFVFSYSLICAPSLQGKQCENYSRSPMDAKLAKIFRSRNGILVKDMWKLQAAQNNSSKLYYKSDYL
ncbi:perforin-1 isoform X3 [Astyanax mexicanus]|uniref:perforin-1 isoform X3 n=1 Tax=Astyanax mexicanus TaxID=7994 RepID=UPI0020CB2B8D|nr:perforin-1 isoform X3 [Astyanax mexicanus]